MQLKANDDEIKAMLLLPKSKSQGFALLVRWRQEQLYWHIRKMVLVHDDANDVLQNTFLKAWNGLENFRGESTLTTWLYRIATNEALTFLANKRLRNVGLMDDEEQILYKQMKADAYFDGNDAESKLQQAILTLPEKQRLVFVMKYFDDITYEQMSEVLNTSVGALKASYHHAVKKIERFFDLSVL